MINFHELDLLIFFEDWLLKPFVACELSFRSEVYVVWRLLGVKRVV